MKKFFSTITNKCIGKCLSQVSSVARIAAIVLVLNTVFQLQVNAQYCTGTDGTGWAFGCNSLTGQAGADQGRYYTFTVVNGVNYTFATCGTVDTRLYAKQNTSAGTNVFDQNSNNNNCGGSASNETRSYTATYDGTLAVGYHDPDCNTWNGTSSTLQYRQNTTVANNTNTSSICAGGTKPLSATLGGIHNNPTVVYSKVGGTAGGSVSGSTYTHSGAAGTVVIRATVGVCTDDITFTVDAATNLGSPSTTGPIDFCSAAGNFGTAVSVTGQTGSVVWDWGSSNGVWNNNWIFGTASGVSMFPKKTHSSDGSADRIRYRVTNGSCGTLTSSTILIQNRYNEAPTSLATSANNYCTPPGTITLTATFPSNINIFGRVRFYSASCGGTLVGTAVPANNTSTAAVTITAPSSTTTYYARYEPESTLGGCANTTCAQVTVNVNTASVAPTGITGTTSVCAGGSTTLTVSGGSLGTGATWQWYSGSCGGTAAGSGTSISVSPASSTTYFVRAEGTCGNTGCASQAIAVNADPSVSITTPSQTICSGGSLTLNSSTSGGTGTCTVQWQSSIDNSIFSNVNTGASLNTGSLTQTTYYKAIYSCSGSGCDPFTSPTVTITVVNDPAITINGAATVCSGGGTTLNALTTPGGTGTCTITWWSSPDNSLWTNTGATGSSYSPTGIAANTYFQARRSCSGTGCDEGTSNSQLVTVVADPDVSITASQQICSNASVTLAATAIGGNGTCTINWHISTDGVSWSPTGSPGATLNTGVLTATRYYRARYSCTGNGCDADTSNVSIVSVVPNPTVGITGSQTVCSGANLTLVATPSSGIGNYVWQFHNGSIWTATGLNSPTLNVGPIVATTNYRVVFIPTGTGCVADTSAISTVSVVSDPVIAIGTSQTICSGGSVTLTSNVVSAGVGTPSYQWQYFDGSSWVNIIIGGAGISYSTPSLTGTTDYRLLYSTTGSGCDQAVSGTVTITVVPDPSVVISGGNTSCGSGSATLTSVVSGGTGTVVYQWQEFDGVSFVNIPSANNPTYGTGVLVDSARYRLRVTASGNGCNVAFSNEELVNVTPVIADNTLSPTYQRFCASGTPAFIDGATPTSGIGTYTYLWQESVNNGGSWLPAAGINNLEDYQPGFTNLTVWYRRVVTSGVCSSTSGNSVVRILALPTVNSATKTDVTCFGGSDGTVTILSATSTNGGLLYSLNGGPFQTSPITGLVANTYNITVQDDSLCTNTFNTPMVVGQPPVLAVNVIDSVDASCANVFDGRIEVVATGGLGAYSYSLNGGPGQASPIFNNVAAGVYAVIVTDGNGCTAADTVTISNSYTVSATLDLVNHVSCFGGADGEIYVTLTGGVLPYSYSINGITFQAVPSFTGLTANNYVVTLRDAKGCSAFLNASVTQPALLTVIVDSVSNLLCNGGTTGGIYISAGGGTSPYTYQWSDGSSNEDLTGVSANTYNVTITDDNGCTAIGGATIAAPLLLSGSIASFTEPACNGDSTGYVDISVAGGVPPYSFNWNNGSIFEDIQNVPMGNYAVTVTDNNSCTITLAQALSEPDTLASTLTQVNILCNGGNSGSIDLDVTGGTQAYTYLWSNAQTTQDVSGLTAGLYTVVVTDANGCSATNAATIIQPGAITFTVNVGNVLCFGDTIGSVNLTVNGGTAPISFTWSNGDTTKDLTNVSAGTYSVSISDGNGCTAVTSATITEPSGIVVNGTVTDVNCYGGNTGSIAISVNGGVFPYSYQWSNLATTQNISGLTGGTYTVTVSDNNGCSTVVAFNVDAPSGPITTIATGTNLNCNGDGNGTASVSVSGGSVPYSYLWSNFANTSSISGLSGGTYFVVVTDVNGCTARDSVIVTEPAAIQLSTSVTHVLCNGDSGTITLTATGGVPVLGYLWSNGATTQNLNDVAGTYTVTVTDGNGCTAVTSATITEPSGIVVNGTVTDVNCYGGNTGSIAISVNGGVFPYSYQWSNLATTQNISGLTGGTYTVTVSDNNGCSTVVAFNVDAPSGPITTIATGTNLNCNGDGNGTASVSVSGGSVPYSYLWSNFANTSSISGLSGGTYFVVVTDVNGCTARDSVIVTEPAAIQLSTSVTHVLCNGDSGTITLTATGGVPVLGYLWSNGATTQNLNDVAGTYTVTVTDGNGCTAVTSATITQPATAIAITGSHTDVTCNGLANGTATINVTGGTVPYSYLWSNGAISQNVAGLSATTYTVTVTDGNGCTATVSYTINEPAALTTSVVGTDVTCAGAANGAAVLTVGGGTTPYSFAWSNFANTQDLNGIGGGKYIVIVTDANGCTGRDSVVIAEPTPIVLSTSVTHVLCNGDSGTITLTATGGVPVLGYLWSNGATTQNLNDVAGTYTVTVTDGNGCTAVTSATITQPATAIAITGSHTDVTCNGLANGTATINVTGGTVPYSYLWSNGAISQNVAGLSAITYTVTVTDGNGCTATVSYTINEPAALTTSVVGTDVTCAGAANGAAVLTVGGGTTPYSFAWSNFANTQDLNGIGGGKYIVIVTDANGCTGRDSVVIAEPTPIVLSTSVTHVLCNGDSGTITLTATGGVPVLGYLWSNGATTQNLNDVAGTYTVTVTDGNGCTAVTSATITQPATAIAITGSHTDVTCNGLANGTATINVTGGTVPYSYLWSNGAISQNVAGLSAITYTVTVTDGNGCTATVSYTINEPAALTTSVVGTDVTCAGAANGAAVLTVGGGTTPYSFAWSNFANTQDLNGIGGGKYIVIVTDANGCTGRDSVVIAEPTPIVLSTSVTHVLCNGDSGTITLTATGGVPVLGYLWSNGATTQNLNDVAGTYTVTVTDGNGCTAVTSATITQPATAIAITGSHTDVTCNGLANGTATINVTGGTVPYSYLWSNGAISQNVAGLSATTYTVTVTDGNGCTATVSYTINEPAALTTSVVGTDVTCAGAANGAAVLTVGGGTTPYSFAWSNFANTQDLNGIGGGKYIVIVTDANGCTGRDSVVIAEPTPIVLSTSVTHVLCNGDSGTITLTATGGVPVLGYLWSNGATTQNLNDVAGTYTVTVTDGNGCTAVTSATITQPATAIAITGSHTDVTCNGLANGTATINVTGGTVPYSYLWSNGAISQNVAGLSAITYTVTVTDGNGCTATVSYTINEPAALTTSVVGTDVTCAGAANGAAVLTVGGGTTPYSFAWSNFANTQDLNGIGGGKYIVIVTDANGCTGRDSVVIAEPQPLVINVVSTTNVNCNAGTTGAIDIDVVGGTIPYNYTWTGGATTQDISTLAAGTYTVTVSDLNGCFSTRTFVITEPAAIHISGVVQNVSCAGAADGAITQAIVGGVQPYTFAWSVPATTQDVAALSGGVYTFTVTDANGCSATATYTVGEPLPLASTITKTDVDCPGAANGAATVAVTGGTLPYTYFWSNFTINQSINSVSGGKYYVIMRDKNNCELRDSVEVLEPMPIVITVDTLNNVSCNGANDGSVVVTVTGGTPAYTYLWSGNAGNTASIAGLAAGAYTLTVTDANNCTQTITVNVAQPLLLSLTGAGIDALCNGASNGKVDITVVGGNIPYSFQWDNAAVTEDLNNVPAGTYNVTVTDAAGCTANGSYTVSEPSAIVSSVVVTDVTCFNQKNGAVDLTVSGGSPPYTFLWSTFQGSEDIANLDGGLKIVIITDKFGCEKRDSAFIFEPQPLVLTTAVNQISCFNANDGAVDLSVAGGTTPYSYQWSNGDTTQDVSQLNGGFYSVTVTDVQGCSAVTSAIIANPSLLNTNALVQTPRCSGESNGSIDLIVSGGTPTYQYAWSNGDTIEDLFNIPSGVYVVSVTDAKGCTAVDTVDVSQPLPLYTTGFVKEVSCFGYGDGFVDITAYGGTLPYFFNWDLGPITEDIGSLAGGTYTVTVTDGNGCTVNAPYTVYEPQKLTVDVLKTDALCFGTGTGTVTSVVTGGMYPYYYLWSNFSVDSFQTGVGAGKYVVVVTDSNYCRAVDSVIVTEPLQIVVSANVVDAKCNGVADGGIDVTVAGGVGPYTYAWAHGPTTEDLSNVAAGVYTLVVTDATGCTTTETYTVGERAPLYTNMSVSSPVCGGGNTGFASVVVNGGQIPYTYSWSTTPQQTGATATALTAGVYVVSITDQTGCVKTDTATLVEPNAIVVTTNTVASKCANTATGKVTATVTGGVAPYVYVLNNVTQASNEFAGLEPGIYTLLVRDVNGCEGVNTFTINSPNAISVDLTTDKQVILSGMKAQLSAVTTSTKNVTHHYWSPLSSIDFTDCGGSANCSNPYAAPTSTTTYTVVVMDEDSCTATDTVRIEVSIAESAFMPSAFSPNGDNLNDRFAFDILGAIEAEVRIFDRWGNLLYENANQLNGVDNVDAWDGTFKGAPVAYDTYVYQMRVKYFDGTTKDITGTIAVMK